MRMRMVSPFQPHWDLYPLVYVAPKISTPLIDRIDGDLTKDVWSKASWSSPFDDIRGPADAPDDYRPRPTCRTRFKALWDDTHLYIGAMLESDFETQAHFTERNSPIYQKDSDFEVFVDPIGCCHDYKELEVNAINTVWNLLLDKPYDDGGGEHSGRIAKPGDPSYYEVYNQKTAVQILKGKLNDEKNGATWSVEIALSIDDIFSNITNCCDRPEIGSMWRINFSRVEKQGDINWVWQPQNIVWCPEEKRYKGYVAMHLPDSWGYMVFGGEHDADNETLERSSVSHPRDPTWPARLAGMNIYYAQHSYKKRNGVFAMSMEQLKDLVDTKIVDPFDIDIGVEDHKPSGQSNDDEISRDMRDNFVATVHDKSTGIIVTVTNDRNLRVQKNSGGRDSLSKS